jgi:hypothetical protein
MKQRACTSLLVASRDRVKDEVACGRHFAGPTQAAGQSPHQATARRCSGLASRFNAACAGATFFRHLPQARFRTERRDFDPQRH